MFIWNNSLEKGARRSAAVVVSMLTEGKLNALCVTGTPGAIESVASLHYAYLDELNLLGLHAHPPLSATELAASKISRSTAGCFEQLQLKALAEEQQAVVKGLQKVEQELAASESDGPVSEVFRKTLKEFTDASGADVRSLSALYAEVGKSADALAYYFGEDPAKCPFEQGSWCSFVLEFSRPVTSTLLNFVGLFRKAHEENIKQIEADKKKAQKEAEKEANQDRTPVKSKDGLVDRSPRSPFK
ncbi:Os04g0244900 [Oryza sativa Japonica Group]|nr:Os04g0244900 [Oryza sativa Japonica Group]|eukprot:NP_001052305.2 Os04g0244900 [Oryza sativa Japonica Group]